MYRYFKLPKKLVDREEFVLNLCKNKRVLHLGCVDFPLLEFRIKSGTWLHGKIMKVAKEVIGIDNAKKEIEYLEKNYGIKNIFYGDVENINITLIKNQKISPPFDIVFAGEIIEHLNNPGVFLEGIKYFMRENGFLIITTINAFCLRRFLRVLLGTESVHPDHKYYFSHSTLSTLLLKHGYKIEEQINYKLPKRPPWIPYIVELIASKISPNLTEGIICVAKT